MWLEEVRAAATNVSFWSRTEFPSENVWVRCAFGNNYMRGCSLFNLPCLLGLRVFTTDSPWKPKLIKFEKRIPPERVAWEFPEEQGRWSRLSEGVRSLLNIVIIIIILLLLYYWWGPCWIYYKSKSMSKEFWQEPLDCFLNISKWFY